MNDAILEKLSHTLANLAIAIHDLQETQQRILHKLDGQQNDVGDVHDAAIVLGVSDRTVKRYKAEYWTEGVHYWGHSKKVIYNLPLLRDWNVNGNGDAHQRAILQWKQTLLSAEVPQGKPGRKRAAR